MGGFDIIHSLIAGSTFNAGRSTPMVGRAQALAPRLDATLKHLDLDGDL